MKVHDIDQVVALYLALQPLSPTTIAEHVRDMESQRILIDRLIENPHTIAYPPTTDYQRKFWKNVVAVLEERGVEIEEAIYERLICTLNTPVRQGPPEASYLTYLLGRPESCTISTSIWCRPPGIDNFSQDYRPLTILESRTTIERGTTGLRTWRASLDLSEWILQNYHIIASARVLELGSGVGLLGLVIATLQQLARPTDSKQTSCIYLTDVDDDVLARCISNVRLPCNMLVDSPSVHVRALDWEDSLKGDRQPFVRSLLEEIDADVILAADVVYDPSIIPPLTHTCDLRWRGHFRQSKRHAHERIAHSHPSSVCKGGRTSPSHCVERRHLRNF
ncbi:putative methyltransferase-domain-containing protein [Rhizoctonia solani]|nr:putative methyltransferase-domain-containing protein [Rhizoctonia solani]